MRRFILALTIAIPLFARADFGPDTIHDNIPGDATVGDILTVGGAVRQQQVDQTLARFAETGTVNAATNALHAAEADHADEADEADLATRALSADAATRAGYAVEAGFATNAQHAAEADRAGTADEADLATRALSADAATIAGYATGALNATNAQHAAVAEHANVADEATEAYHAETATRATTADHAAEADVAYRYIEVDLTTNAMYAAEAGHATNAEHAVEADYANHAEEAEFSSRATHSYGSDTATTSLFADYATNNVSYVLEDNKSDAQKARARENIGLDEEWMKTLWSYAGFANAGVQALAGNSAFAQMLSTNIENYVYGPTYLGWLGVYVDARSYTSILGAWDDEDFVEKANAWGDERYAKAADTNAVHYTEDLGKTEEQKAQARANIGADWSNAYWTLDAKTWLTGTSPYSANLWSDAMWTLDAKTWLTGSGPYSANLWRDAMWTLDAKTWLTGSGPYSANLWRDAMWTTSAKVWLTGSGPYSANLWSDGQWITQADSWLSTKNIKKADGAARPLPKYLHALDFADSYTNDAAWYYNQPQDYGSCSAMRDGGFLYRNYDWKLDDAAEFVIRMAAGPGRFASVGVANVGTNLTEDIVTSGKWSRYYKCLPGRTVDGINENGVVAEVNVVDGDPQTSGWHDTGDLHPLAAVRWALDHGTNAQQAATYLAANIRFPAGWAQNFHWMISDERETWIVEDGSAHKETGKVVMTNFGLYPEYHDAQGWERWMILTNETTSTITNVWFTHAYWQVSHPYRPNWDTDFNSLQEMYDAKSVWASHSKEQLRGKGFWQSVHTSVYDITNRVLSVAVQEVDDWYTFNMPITASNIGALTKESATKLIDEKVAANLNTYIDGETGVEYEGKFYGGSLFYVPTGNVYPPNN